MMKNFRLCHKKNGETIFANNCMIYNFFPKYFFHKTYRSAEKFKKPIFALILKFFNADMGSKETFHKYIIKVSLTSIKCSDFWKSFMKD